MARYRRVGVFGRRGWPYVTSQGEPIEPPGGDETPSEEVSQYAVYISPSGNDTYGDGSFANPLATLQAGINALVSAGPGYTLYLRGGLYREFPHGQFSVSGGGGRGAIFWNLNDATSWGSHYTIRSYPGEWAVLDGGDYNSEDVVYLLYGGSTSGVVGYVEVCHLEIRNIYTTSHAAAICTRGGPYWFHHLYVHDCTCAIANNNPAGLLLENGVGDTLIEYCYFRANGYLGANENAANLALFSDYTYACPSSLHHATTGFSTSRHNNEVRYCLFDGGSGGSVTGCGIKEKASQYLAHDVVANEAISDINGFSAQGNHYHHNIILNAAYAGIYTCTDFNQIHHNIVVPGAGCTNEAIRVGSEFIAWSRGAWSNVVYNNTVIGGKPGVAFAGNSAGTYKSTTLYSRSWAYNNILDAPTAYDSQNDLSFHRAYSGGISWDVANLLRAKNNYFYRPASSDLVRVMETSYTLSGANAASWGGSNRSNAYNAGDLLYAGASGADLYKTRGAHVLESGVTISSGGVGGSHPYLSGVDLPSYVGATDPSDDDWVDTVLGLVTSLGA